jgi:hypothetical protein
MKAANLLFFMLCVLQFAAAQNVGIGTDNPITPLHLKGDDDILTLEEKP